jgi:hypothetical protein
MTTTARPGPATQPDAQRGSAGMTRLERNANLAGVVVPFLGTL